MKKTLLLFITLFCHYIFAQSDCPTAIAVCGNSSISYTPTGPGNILEDLGGCLSSDEHFSVWYTFTAATSGTLAFTITSNNLPDDYDFGVYGPNKPCGSLGAPIRCNYAGSNPAGVTGLSLTPPYTGYWDRYLDVIAGETYYLVVDNFSRSANGFSLTWSGTATLVSPFNDPILVPNPFITPGLPNANPNSPNEVIVCSNPAIFNFSTLSTGIINGNPNFTVNYYLNTNDMLSGNNSITTPIVVNTTDTYYYSISYVDRTNSNSAISKCKQYGEFKFKLGNFTANDVTLTECNNNNRGLASYNLTNANVYADPTFTKKYYPSMNDLNNGTNEIVNPYQYTSAEGSVYVLVTSPFGCTDIAEIKLKFYPLIITNNATLRSCYQKNNISTGEFDLTTAVVNNQAGTTNTYYPSLTDAINGTNEITTPNAYIAPNGVVYVRVSNANGCFNIATINLIVFPPVYSTVLQDKIICSEETTTLDAGPGFDGYIWDNGSTTQTSSNNAIGTHWVDLITGTCTTRQYVNVYASENPVITNIDYSNNNISVNVVGGTPAYQYSIDNITWQNSNSFTNMTRGDHTIYVKDAYNCNPIQLDFVVPNIINVITPNGDGINDVIDYSALSNKQNLLFTIFDRYGAKIYQADKSNGYKWNGTNETGKKIPTGNYWYTITWNENNKNNTAFKFAGWILVKNRD